MVRRWNPKGTDLSRLRYKSIIGPLYAVNHITRPVSLKGMSAYEAFQLLQNSDLQKEKTSTIKLPDKIKRLLGKNQSPDKNWGRTTEWKF